MAESMEAMTRIHRVIAVTGGRDYADRERVFVVLDAELVHGIDRIVHGACPTGVDAFADAWAKERGVSYQWYPADWKYFGRSAGPMRNRQMLTESRPSLLIAFPGGKGTANCVFLAETLGIPILFIV